MLLHDISFAHTDCCISLSFVCSFLVECPGTPIRSDQSLSRVWLFETPRIAARHHQLPEFTETHVHRVGDAIQPSHPLSSPSPPAPDPSQHQTLFQWVSLQHRTLLLSPVTSTAGYSFCFGSIPSLFLELFLHWSPVAYWAPNDLGSFSFSILSFCLFILFMGFSRQEYWSGLPFPSPVDHILSDLSTMTRPSPRAWLSFIELDKAVVVIGLDWIGW